MPLYEFQLRYEGTQFPQYRGKVFTVRMEAPENFKPTPEFLASLLADQLTQAEAVRRGVQATYREGQAVRSPIEIAAQVAGVRPAAPSAKPTPAPPQVPQTAWRQAGGVIVPQTAAEIQKRRPVVTQEAIDRVAREYFSPVANWFGFRPTTPMQWLDLAKRAHHAGIELADIDNLLERQGASAATRAYILSQLYGPDALREGWAGRIATEGLFFLHGLSWALGTLPLGLGQTVMDTLTVLSAKRPQALSREIVGEAFQRLTGKQPVQPTPQEVKQAQQRLQAQWGWWWDTMRTLFPHEGWAKDVKELYGWEGLVGPLFAILLTGDALALGSRLGARGLEGFALRDFRAMAREVLERPVPEGMTAEAHRNALVAGMLQLLRERVSQVRGKDVGMTELLTELRGKSARDVARMIHPQAVTMADALEAASSRLQAFTRLANPLAWVGLTEDLFRRYMEDYLGIPRDMWERYYEAAKRTTRAGRTERATEPPPRPEEPPPTATKPPKEPQPPPPAPEATTPEPAPPPPAPEATTPEPAPPPVALRPMDIPPTRVGTEARAYTASNEPVDTRFAVVELDDLKPSHTPDTFHESPEYPQELQPRDRSAAAMRDQVRQIAANLVPDKLGQSPHTFTGAPIVGTDGIVESGNGRVLALNMAYAYDMPSAQAYRQWLLERASEFGIDPSEVQQMRRPVLVRLREPEANIAERARMAREMALSDVAAMSPTEQAMQDARIAGRHIEAFVPDADIDSPLNRRFVESFLRDIATADKNEMVLPDGSLSLNGRERIERAIVAYGYDDEGLVRALFDSPDVETKRLARGIVGTAPKMARLKEQVRRAVQAGIERARDYDITRDIADAFAVLENLKRRGVPVRDYLQQASLFDEFGASDTVRRIVGDVDRLRSVKAVSTYLERYAEGATRAVEALAAPAEAQQLARERPRTPLELLADAYDWASSGGTPSLFEQPEPAQQPPVQEAATAAPQAEPEAAPEPAAKPETTETPTEPQSVPLSVSEEVIRGTEPIRRLLVEGVGVPDALFDLMQTRLSDMPPERRAEIADKIRADITALAEGLLALAEREEPIARTLAASRGASHPGRAVRSYRRVLAGLYGGSPEERAAQQERFRALVHAVGLEARADSAVALLAARVFRQTILRGPAFEWVDADEQAAIKVARRLLTDAYELFPRYLRSLDVLESGTADEPGMANAEVYRAVADVYAVALQEAPEAFRKPVDEALLSALRHPANDGSVYARWASETEWDAEVLNASVRLPDGSTLPLRDFVNAIMEQVLGMFSPEIGVRGSRIRAVREGDLVHAYYDADKGEVCVNVQSPLFGGRKRPAVLQPYFAYLIVHEILHQIDADSFMGIGPQFVREALGALSDWKALESRFGERVYLSDVQGYRAVSAYLPMAVHGAEADYSLLTYPDGASELLPQSLQELVLTPLVAFLSMPLQVTRVLEHIWGLKPKPAEIGPRPHAIATQTGTGWYESAGGEEEPARERRVYMASMHEDAWNQPLIHIVFRLGRWIRAGGRAFSEAFYDPTTGDIAIRRWNDLPAAMEAIAQSLDDEFAILEPWAKPRVRSPFDEELFRFLPEGRNWDNVRLAERRRVAFGRFLLTMVMHPQEAAMAAPQFWAYLHEELPSPLWEELMTLTDDVQRWLTSPAGEKIRSQYTLFRPFPPDTGAFTINWLDRMINALFDDRWYALKAWREAKRRLGVRDIAPSRDFELLITLWAGRWGKLEDAIENGVPKTQTGELRSPPVKEIFAQLDTSSFDTLKQDVMELFAVMGAQRALEKWGQVQDNAGRAVARRLRQAKKSGVQLGDVGQQFVQRLDARENPPEEGEGDEIDDEAFVLGTEFELFTLDDLRELRDELQAQDSELAPLVEKVVKQVEAARMRITGWGGGVIPDDEVARQHLDYLATQEPERLARLRRAAAVYREIADALLSYAKDTGRLSAEDVTRIRASNEFYQDWHRVFGMELPQAQVSTSGRVSRVRAVTWKWEGSTRQIHNPIASLLESIARVLSECDRNYALAQFTRALQLERDLYEGEPMLMADIGRRVPKGTPNAIPVWVDGQATYWQFHPDVKRSLDMWQQLDTSEAWSLFAKIFGALARLAHQGVVLHWRFALWNFLRDALERLVRSPFGPRLPRWDAETFRKWRESGGSHAGLYERTRDDYYKEFERLFDEAYDKGIMVVAHPKMLAKRAWHGYVKALERAEEAGRLGEYRAAYRYAREELGYDERDAQLFAAFASRRFLDFRVAGHLMRIVNRFVPFTTASIRALSMTLEPFAPFVQAVLSLAGSGGEKGGGIGQLGDVGGSSWAWDYREWGVHGLPSDKSKGYSVLLRIVLFLMLPELLIRLHNGQDEDTWEEYQEFPAYLRYMFWLIHTPWGWVGIPKPYELGVLGGLLGAITDNDLLGWARTLGRVAIPFDETDIALGAAGILGAIANYDFFRGRWIVPPSEERRALELRRPESASALGRVLGEAFQIDPRKVDYFIRQSMGNWGQTLMQASDVLAGERELGETITPQLGVTRELTPPMMESVQRVRTESAAKGRESFATPLEEQIRLYYRLRREGRREQAESILRRIRRLARSQARQLEKIRPIPKLPRPL